MHDDSPTPPQVTLRPLCPQDAEALFAACIDPLTQQWTTLPPDYTLDAARAFIADPHLGKKVLAIEFNGRYAGHIEARLPEDGRVTVGYLTAPWARGRGVQTRALELLTTQLHVDGVEEVYLYTATTNAASRRVAEKAGYRFVGVTPGVVATKAGLLDRAEYVHRS